MTALNGVARPAGRVQEASWAVKSGYEGRLDADERQLSAVCSTAKNDRQKPADQQPDGREERPPGGRGMPEIPGRK
jgi:hypothetical protein